MSFEGRLRRFRWRQLLSPLFIAVILVGLLAPASPGASAASPTPIATGEAETSPPSNIDHTEHGSPSQNWAKWLKENNIDEATYGGDPANPVVPRGGAVMPHTGAPILGPGRNLPAILPQAAPSVCDQFDPSRVKTFNVSAIDVFITINRFGDNNPQGKMFVLDENLAAVRAQEAKPLPDRVSAGLRDDPIQPLVIRANVGECVVVNFTNRLAGGRASMNVRGLSVAAREAGSNVGLNPDTTIRPGESIAYHWAIDNRPELEGSYVFRSLGEPRQQQAHGLFGVINVEPAGSTYLNPNTGQPQKSGWEAIIVDPNGRDFREDTIMYHEFGDEQFDMRDVNGASLPLNDFLGVYKPGTRLLNYRSEPFFRRLEASATVLGRHDESQSYGSYMNGDPATPFPRGYRGDPTKRRIVHPGSERFHSEHLHGGSIRWPFDPTIAPDFWGLGFNKFPPSQSMSQRLDVQTVGPMEAYTEQPEGSAGGLQQGAGEFLFHCHFPHHYIGGMWAFWRVFDTLQTAQTTLPGQPPLVELPDRAGQTPLAVSSIGLLGKPLPSGKVLTDGPTTAATRNIDEWMRSVLPPQGLPQGYDASVWDWVRKDTASGPMFLSEPETTHVWPNYRSPTPGQRIEILFNPTNGRPTFPLLRPHLGKRPPFAPNRSGSPWLGEPDADHPDSLIPAGASRQQYTVVAVPMPIDFNTKFKLSSLSGALMVLDEDKEDILAGRKPKEQLTIRANVRDGVDVTYYSEETDVAFFGFAKTNIHIHFVQFDTQASDGVISGMSYEQSVRPYQTEGAAGTGIRLTQAAPAGSNVLKVDDASTLKVNGFVGVGFGVVAAKPGGFEFAQIVSRSGNTLTLDRPLKTDHPAGQFAGTEFVRYQWYADVEEGTTFFHDHVFGVPGFGKALTGSLIVEPEGSQWLDPTTGQPIRSGTKAIIRTNRQVAPGVPIQDYREFVLHEMGAITDLRGQLASRGEPGGFNMKVEPLDKRIQNNPDWSLVFSSVAHGDPETPLLRAYLGDLVSIRLIQSSGHDMTSFHMSGHRFRLERFDPREAPKSALSLGIAERFDLFFTAGSVGLQAGDYVYMQGPEEKMRDGAWGLLRVHDSLQADLLPLVNNGIGFETPAEPLATGFPQLTQTGGRPARAVDTGAIVPSGMPVRTFNVAAIETPIEFSKTIRIDKGRIYILAEDEADIRAGRKPVEPLALRANVGEAVRVNFTNKLPKNRASFHMPELIQTTDSQGTAFGFNRDSTLGPGESTTQWFVIDPRFEVPRSFPIFDFGDPIEGPASGMFGIFIVEPAGSTFHDPKTGAEVKAGTVVDVRNPALPGGSFKDAALIFYDDDQIMNRDVMPYRKDVEGVRGINLKAMPAVERLAEDSDFAKVFKTGGTHSDPPTPVIEARAGEPVRLHVMGGPGHQPHVFSVDGHRFPFDVSRPNNAHFSARQFAPMVTIDAVLDGGAGGTMQAAGDYLFGDMRGPFLEAGLWGLLRVSTPGAFTAIRIDPGLLETVPSPLSTRLRADATPTPEGLPAGALVRRVIEGVVTGIDEGKQEWRIGNPPVFVSISSETQIDSKIRKDDLVSVIALRTLTPGPLVATDIKLLEAGVKRAETPDMSESLLLTGIVEAAGPHIWRVAGIDFVVDAPGAPAAIAGGLGVGESVTVEFVGAGGGVRPTVAAAIASQQQSASFTPGKEVRFTDKVISTLGNRWMVGGQTVQIDGVTRLVNDPQVGNRVEVRAAPQSDGSVLATEIRNLDKPSRSSRLATIIPPPTPPISPMPPPPAGSKIVKSATVLIAGESYRVDFTEFNNNGQVSAIVTLPSHTQVSYNANWRDFRLEQILANAIGANNLVLQAVALAAGAKPVSRPILTPLQETAPPAVSAQTAASGSSDKPTSGPSAGAEVRFQGIVGGTGNAMWLIAVTPVAVSSATKLVNSPTLGDAVEVRAIQQKDGSLLATEIRYLGIAPPSPAAPVAPPPSTPPVAPPPPPPTGGSGGPGGGGGSGGSGSGGSGSTSGGSGGAKPAG